MAPLTKCPVCSSESDDLSKIWPHPSKLSYLPLYWWKMDWGNVADNKSACRYNCIVCGTVISALIDARKGQHEPGLGITNSIRACLMPLFCTINQRYMSMLVLISIGSPNPAFVQINPPVNIQNSDEFGLGGEVLAHGGSPKALGLARRLLDTCRTTHPECASRLVDYIPSRLLDLGDDDLGNEDLRLVLRSEVQGIVDYVALSYCWGGDQYLKTTNENVESHRTRIPFKELPKTFEDAVKVTKSLGMRYIWIDSLCIIQGDEKDWEQESGQMENVYDSAELVISAANSHSARQGFLGDRPDPPTVHHISFMLDGQTTPMEFTYRALAEHIDEPLEHRAWAFQEKLLARRNLEYRSGDLAWHCCKESSCECGYQYTVEYNWRFEPTLNLDYMFKKTPDLTKLSMDQILPRHSLMPPNLTELWMKKIVPGYSSRELTKTSDRLVALSAVAARVQSQFDGTYLAGLWKEDLVHQLLWEVSRKISIKAYPKALDGAPSWSWASISHGGTEPTRNPSWLYFTIIADIIDASVTPSTANRFGPVSSGIIKIRAKLIQAELHHDSDHEIEQQDVRIPNPKYETEFWFTGMSLIAYDFTLDSATEQRVTSVRRMFHTENDIHLISTGVYAVWLLPLLLSAERSYANAMMLGPRYLRLNTLVVSNASGPTIYASKIWTCKIFSPSTKPARSY